MIQPTVPVAEEAVGAAAVTVMDVECAAAVMLTRKLTYVKI